MNHTSSCQIISQNPNSVNWIGGFHFEPDQSLAEVYQKNMLQNGITNFILHKAAVWTENGTISFNNMGSEASSIDVSGNSQSKVPTVKLASLLSEYTHIDLLKIDIEGADVLCLKSLINQDHLPEHLSIELLTPNNLAGKKVNSLEIISYLYVLGFLCVLIQTTVRKQWNLVVLQLNGLLAWCMHLLC